MGKTIGGFFGRSAFGPLQELAGKVLACVDRLEPLFVDWIAGDRDAMLEHARIIDKLEGEADTIKSEIRASLSTSIFSTAESGKIREVIKATDDAADLARRVGRHVEVRDTPMPKKLGQKLIQLTGFSKRTTALLVTILTELDSAGENRNLQNNALAHFAELEELRHDTQEHYGSLLENLFDREKKLDPVSVILLMRIIESVEGIAGCIENASESLMQLVGRS